MLYCAQIEAPSIGGGVPGRKKTARTWNCVTAMYLVAPLAVVYELR